MPLQFKTKEITYEVNLAMLRGKKIIEIPVSNSGMICIAWEYPAEDLASQSRKVTVEPLSCLNNLDFEYLTDEEKEFLHGEWQQYYIPMINQIRDFLNLIKNNRLNLLKGNALNVDVSMPQLIQCQINSGANYPLSYSADTRN